MASCLPHHCRQVLTLPKVFSLPTWHQPLNNGWMWLMVRTIQQTHLLWRICHKQALSSKMYIFALSYLVKKLDLIFFFCPVFPSRISSSRSAQQHHQPQPVVSRRSFTLEAQRLERTWKRFIVEYKNHPTNLSISINTSNNKASHRVQLWQVTLLLSLK